MSRFSASRQSIRQISTSCDLLALVQEVTLMMNRFAWLFLTVLCSAILVNAADKEMNGTMSGWVCDSSCVVQQGDRPTCDPACTERSGNDVFISDEGVVSTISNPDVCIRM